MSIDLTGGHGPELDSVLEKAPDKPDCREGENMWLFE